MRKPPERRVKHTKKWKAWEKNKKRKPVEETECLINRVLYKQEQRNWRGRNHQGNNLSRFSRTE